MQHFLAGIVESFSLARGIQEGGPRSVVLRHSLLNRQSACAELVPVNRYSRTVVQSSDGLTDDMQLQGNRIVQPCRPGNGEFNRDSLGQGVGGLD